MKIGRDRLVGLFALAAILAAFVCLAAAPPALAQTARTGTLVIRVSGVGAGKVQVRIAVFDSERTWLDTDAARFRTVLEDEGPERVWHVEHAPYGEYAVAVVVDRNRDGKLNRNLVGAPTEPYGVSNNARRALGPARWNDARFELSSDTTTIAIGVR